MASLLITWLVLFLVALGLLYKFILPGYMARNPDRDDFLENCAFSLVVSAVVSFMVSFLLVVLPVVLVILLVLAGALFGIRYAMNKLYDRHTKS